MPRNSKYIIVVVGIVIVDGFWIVWVKVQLVEGMVDVAEVFNIWRRWIDARVIVEVVDGGAWVEFDVFERC